VFRLDSAKCAHLRKASPCPSDGQIERRLIDVDIRQRVLTFGLTLFDELRLLFRDPLQQFRRRFVVRVLRHELAAHGEVEDGLAEVLDLVRARGEGGQRAEGEAGAGLKGFGIGRVEASEARRRQLVAGPLAALPRFASSRLVR
jgi:hypothetical protein